MLSTNAQSNARANMLMPLEAPTCNNGGMRDWAIDYILKVLEIKDWSANRLSVESGVAASTINRPLREPDWPHKLSRGTISKIARASGIDPSPYIPEGFAEDKSLFSGPAPITAARRILEQLDDNAAKIAHPPTAMTINEIKIAVVGPLAQIVATVDRAGLAKLRLKLDAIESMLDDI